MRSTSPYLFPTRASGSASPLWGLTVVETPAMGTHNALLIDAQMLGVLYLGTTRFDANPFSQLAKNLTDLRVETNALYHLRNVQGALFIGAVS